MLNQSDLLLWLRENLKRIGAKTPRFFRTWGWINLAMSAVGAIPKALVLLDITLPPVWMLWVGKAMIAAGIWGRIQNFLAVSVPTPEIMPFTAKKELEKQIEQTDNTLK